MKMFRDPTNDIVADTKIRHISWRLLFDRETRRKLELNRC